MDKLIFLLNNISEELVMSNKYKYESQEANKTSINK